VQPVVSVIIASDRVESSLSDCLSSLERQEHPTPFEVLIASSSQPRPTREFSFPWEWIAVEARNPATRRNLASRLAKGSVLAFLDDDAEAEPEWLASGARALENAELAGGPDVGPAGAPYLERVSDLLLATPRIGSGVPAHERRAPEGPVRSPHDVALCNLFVRRDAYEALGGLDESLGYVGEDTDFVNRALAQGLRVRLDPAVRVRHRRRPFPGGYLAQRWRYRVKTGRLFVERPGLYSGRRMAAFLSAGFLASAGAAIFGMPFVLPAAAAYAGATWAFSFPIWRRDPALFPAVPVAFALHHLTYFAGLLTGIARGLLTVAAR
jgi:glycosyltransferase involved in cell wall biosynthesis